MQSSTFEWFVCASVLFGIGAAAMLPLMAILTKHHFTVQDFPAASGVANIFFFSLSAIGVFIAAFGRDLFASFRPFWILSFVLLAIAQYQNTRLGPRTVH